MHAANLSFQWYILARTLDKAFRAWAHYKHAAISKCLLLHVNTLFGMLIPS